LAGSFAKYEFGTDSADGARDQKSSPVRAAYSALPYAIRSASATTAKATIARTRPMIRFIFLSHKKHPEIVSTQTTLSEAALRAQPAASAARFPRAMRTVYTMKN
jgi:hypothetical protein